MPCGCPSDGPARCSVSVSVSEPEDDTSSSSQESATCSFLDLDLGLTAAFFESDVFIESFATSEEISDAAGVEDITAEKHLNRFFVVNLPTWFRAGQPSSFTSKKILERGKALQPN